MAVPDSVKSAFSYKEGKLRGRAKAHQRARSVPPTAVSHRKLAVRQRREELIKQRIEELYDNVRNKHREEKRACSREQKQSLHQVVVNQETVTRRNETPLQMFRRYAGIVLTLSRVFVFIRRTRFDLDSVYLKTDEKQKKGKQSGYDSLCFDANFYKANKETTWPESALDCVMRTPWARTEDDCRRIHEIMRTLPSFRKYTDDMQILLSKIVEYTKCPKNRVIVRKGHVGHCFYFIFSGTLSVVLDKEEDSVFTRPEVGLLTKGDVFGEVALLKDTVRKATVVCATDSEVLLVDRSAFEGFGLNDLFMKKCQYMVDFVSQMDLFSTWSNEDVEEICFVSKMESYNYKKVIDKDSRKSNWLYIITKGSCEVLRLVDLKKSNDFVRLVSKEEIEALHETFRSVFFDLKSLHSFITMIQREHEERQRRVIGEQDYNRSAAISPSLLTNFSSSTRINSDSLAVIHKLEHRHSSSGSLATSLVQGRPQTGSTQTSRNQGRPRTSGTRRPNMHGSGRTPHRQSAPQTEGLPRPNAESGKGGERRMAIIPDLYVENFEGIGAFVKVDTLMPGDIFGFHSSDNDPLSLVSKGVELIRVSLGQFRAQCDRMTRRKADTMIRIYPNEEELCSSIFRKAEWNIFCSNIGESVRTRTQLGGKSGKADYFKRRSSFTPANDLSGLPRVAYSPVPMSVADASLLNDYEHQSGTKLASKPRLKTALPRSSRRSVTMVNRPKSALARTFTSQSTVSTMNLN